MQNKTKVEVKVWKQVLDAIIPHNIIVVLEIS